MRNYSMMLELLRYLRENYEFKEVKEIYSFMKTKENGFKRTTLNQYLRILDTYNLIEIKKNSNNYKRSFKYRYKK